VVAVDDDRSVVEDRGVVEDERPVVPADAEDDDEAPPPQPASPTATTMAVTRPRRVAATRSDTDPTVSAATPRT
jgi:hypothetical protein